MAIRTLGSRYLLDEQIGQGGMGVVWRGRDKVTGAPFAIKLLRSEYAADPDAVTRFVRERTVLMKFRHPAVVTLHDMIVEGEQLALVMDLVGGGDLNAYRQRAGGALSSGEAARLAAQICDGLAAAHAAGIVHRDLKPANVLLDGGQVKLADFGVARIVGDNSATTTGTVLGTAAYLAPELLTGSDPSPASDVYAFGITLYELLAGRPPFTGHVAAIMHDHIQTEPPRLNQVPEPFWDLLSSCLSKDPAGRRTAASMASALRDPVLLAALGPGPGQGPAAAGAMVTVGAGPLAAPVPAGPPLAGQPARLAPPQAFAQGPMSLPPVATPRPDQALVTEPALDAFAPVIPLHSQPPAAVPAPPAQSAAAPAQSAAAPAQSPAAPAPAGPVAPGPVSPFPGSPPPGTQASGPPFPPLPARPASQRNPLVAGVAAAVVVALVVGGLALGHIGPFATGHKTLAGDGPTGASTSSGVNQGQRTNAPTSSAGPSPKPSTRHNGRGSKKPNPKKSLPAVTPGSPGNSSSPKPGTTKGTLTAYGPNLIDNGNFADGTLGGWNYAVENAAVDPGSGPGNVNAVALTANPQAGVAEVITGLAPGKHYLVTGWAEQIQSPIFIGAMNDDDAGDGKVHFTVRSGSWTHGSVIFTLGRGQTSAIVFCVQANGSGSCANLTFQAMRYK